MAIVNASSQIYIIFQHVIVLCNFHIQYRHTIISNDIILTHLFNYNTRCSLNFGDKSWWVETAHFRVICICLENLVKKIVHIICVLTESAHVKTEKECSINPLSNYAQCSIF